jgi:23S rRNA (uridine2479-2'-O)-methyltransferase
VIASRNARFQELAALLTNRAKRQRSGEFLVQGVRPITLAVEHGPVRCLLYAHGRRLSSWARGLLDRADAVPTDPALLAELADKPDAELVAVAALPPDDLSRIAVGGRSEADERAERPAVRAASEEARATMRTVIVLDRPSDPGNIGTVVRSADAFGAAGVVVTGHAADPYDPKAVRASTGSLFAVPVVRVSAPRTVIDWARSAGMRIIGSDEAGTVGIDACDLRGLIVIGNETRGMSAAWFAACDDVACIPIGGAASSLNAASAATVFLYEAARKIRKRR